MAAAAPPPRASSSSLELLRLRRRRRPGDAPGGRPSVEQPSIDAALLAAAAAAAKARVRARDHHRRDLPLSGDAFFCTAARAVARAASTACAGGSSSSLIRSAIDLRRRRRRAPPANNRRQRVRHRRGGRGGGAAAGGPCTIVAPLATAAASASAAELRGTALATAAAYASAGSATRRGPPRGGDAGAAAGDRATARADAERRRGRAGIAAQPYEQAERVVEVDALRRAAAGRRPLGRPAASPPARVGSAAADVDGDGPACRLRARRQVLGVEGVGGRESGRDAAAAPPARVGCGRRLGESRLFGGERRLRRERRLLRRGAAFFGERALAPGSSTGVLKTAAAAGAGFGGLANFAADPSGSSAPRRVRAEVVAVRHCSENCAAAGAAVGRLVGSQNAQLQRSGWLVLFAGSTMSQVCEGS